MPSSVQVLLAILSCKRFFILKIVDDDMGEQDILLKIVDDNNNIFLHLMKYFLTPDERLSLGSWDRVHSGSPHQELHSSRTYTI